MSSRNRVAPAPAPAAIAVAVGLAGLALATVACDPSSADPAAIAPQEAVATTQVRGELIELMSQQEVYYSRHGTWRYAGPAADASTVDGLAFAPEHDVHARIVAADDRGWAGVAWRDGAPGRGCAVYVGSAAPAPTPGGRTPSEAGHVLCD